MTLPLRKKRQITASTARIRISGDKSVRILFLLMVTGGLLLANSNAIAQVQEPPKFQKPTSFRYLLGVRNEKSSGYGAQQKTFQRAAPTRQYASAPAANNPSQNHARQGRLQGQGIGYRDIGLDNQPVGTGVRAVPQSQRAVAREARAQVAHQETAIQKYSVEPINDPFGDLDNQFDSQTTHRRNQNGGRRASHLGVRAAGRSVSYNSPVQQESILRRPANAPTQNRPERNSSFGRPGNFSLDPPRGGYRQEQESPNNSAGGNLQNGNPQAGNPMQDPMTQPMQRVPMQQDPMVETPMRNQDQDQDPLRQQIFELNCDDVKGVMINKSIRDIALNLKLKVDPGKVLPQDCEFEGGVVRTRQWTPQTVHWTASAACSKPLYFQHVQLERYGHTRGPVVQPVISAAHFFGNIAMLPYKSFFHPPNECVYALGYYRPGDCAPWLQEPFPWPSFNRVANPACSIRGRRF